MGEILIVAKRNALAVFTFGKAFHVLKTVTRIGSPGVLAGDLVPFSSVRDGIDRRFAKIFFSYEVIDRFRQSSLVGRILIDRAAHLPKVFLQHSFASMLDALLIGRKCDGDKYDENEHSDHQLEQRKTRRPMIRHSLP